MPVKKILHLLYSGLGGHGSVFFSMAKAAPEEAYAFGAIFCGIEPVREDYVRKCGEEHLPYQSVVKKRGLDPGVYVKLYRFFKKGRPDVLFLHGSTFILSAAVYKIFHRKCRLVVRDTQAHHLKTKMEWRWLKLAARVSDKIVFLTKESFEDAVKKTGSRLLQHKGVIIGNGLDTGFYRPEPHPHSGKIRIGMQSRLQPIKDHPTLINAFALLVQQHPDKELELHIAGDGETRPALEQLVSSLGIQTLVQFHGMLNEADLRRFMLDLDIYVHATDGETMSNSIMQALSCGLPVIASDVWGVNNMITPNENGLLYEHRSKTELAARIGMLMHDPGLASRLSAAGRNYAEKEFSPIQVFNKYAALF